MASRRGGLTPLADWIVLLLLERFIFSTNKTIKPCETKHGQQMNHVFV